MQIHTTSPKINFSFLCISVLGHAVHGESCCAVTVCVRVEGRGIGAHVKDTGKVGKGVPPRGCWTQTVVVDVPVWAQGDVEQEQGPSPDDGG